MINPYETCPVYENENFLLRFVEASDASDLLCVYSDETAVPYFNSDNCEGNFHCTLLEHVQGMIAAWQEEYNRQGFVRWSIIDKRIRHAVGTLELFNRQSNDYFTDCGILRLDLRSDYEQEEPIGEILSMIAPPSFELFDCKMIATKIPPFAAERKAAAKKLGFIESNEKVIGHHQEIYTDYYVLRR